MSVIDRLNDIKEIIDNAKKIVVLTGAGVSTESGIPDFRSHGGFWDSDESREYYISRSYYNRKPKDFWKKYKEIFDMKLMGDYEPNKTHYFLKKLEDMGKDIIIATQNIDGLHQKAGSTKVFEMHGTLKTAVCPKCKTEYDINKIIDEEVPRCDKTNTKGTVCNFILNTNVVLFGDPIKHFEDVLKEIDSADVFISMGTSLEVYPVNTLIDYARMNWECINIILNREPTKMDHKFTYILNGEFNKIIDNLL